VVEHDLAKVGVEGSSPFARSKTFQQVKLSTRGGAPSTLAGSACRKIIVKQTFERKFFQLNQGMIEARGNTLLSRNGCDSICRSDPHSRPK
jgi:hypothetical protein